MFGERFALVGGRSKDSKNKKAKKREEKQKMAIQFTFKKSHKGLYGDGMEMTVKALLGIKDALTVSPAGKCDFRYAHHNYDVKQNGTCLQYVPNTKYIKGSSRVIYATHIAYTVIAETEEEITFTVDLENTEFFEVDKKEFLRFLDGEGATKYNSKRQQVNIQTSWNYTKNARHGRLAERIEAWCYEHELDDCPVKDALIEALGI